VPQPALVEPSHGEERAEDDDEADGFHEPDDDQHAGPAESRAATERQHRCRSTCARNEKPVPEMDLHVTALGEVGTRLFRHPDLRCHENTSSKS
jgi:hypothetical protein